MKLEAIRAPQDPAFGPESGKIRRIAMIGNFLPRRCGIATYTTDVCAAMVTRFPQLHVDVWAINDGKTYDYPAAVTGTIEQADPGAYLHAAREITASGADMVWIQHEFGIFGGTAGEFILPLIERLTVPVAVAMHTVLEMPTPGQRRVTLALVERCETLIVMADEARRILCEVYGADAGQVVVIPHGIPDRALVDAAPFKARIGAAGREVVMTFGLLSPNKGIEAVIAALPALARRHPQVLYFVLGATHPNFIAGHGETYRDKLVEQAAALGVSDNIRFVDRFFETDELLDYLAAADVYITPYLNPAQVTSGTLAYAAGLGRAIVSTPYVHARELLGDGHGVLVDFADSAAIAEALDGLLSDSAARSELQRRIYARSRGMIWARLAEASLDRFEAVAAAQQTPAPLLRLPAVPGQLGQTAIERMCDATGMFQHSIFTVPDRRHGYCIDDNARALILACRCPGAARSRLPTFSGFVAHAWNPDVGRFRNFMRYDRSWCEAIGSDDSNGRAIWALGIAAAEGPEPGVRDWARKLWQEVTPRLDDITSPRARAFMMLGHCAYGDAAPAAAWGEALMELFSTARRAGWEWFEPVLAYDNARLPEALIRAGSMLGRADFVTAGLATLQWLWGQQSGSDGVFTAVGSDSFGRPYAPPLPYDQQPVEAWAMVDACDTAARVSGDEVWGRRALAAYKWFLGRNTRAMAIADPLTGECRDGLMPAGINGNCGAESILAFHLATVAVQRWR